MQPCKALKPILEELAAQMREKVTFVTINVDQNPLAPQICDVRAMPTLVYYRKGRIQGARTGSASASIIREWVNYHLMAR